jgi:phage terminase small subunit
MALTEYGKDRREARRLYLESGGKLSLAEIARHMGRPASTVRNWKRNEGWDELMKGREGEDKPVLHLSHVPGEVRTIMEAARGMDEKALLWEVILYQYASIVRAQELMHVRDENDTRFLARGEGEPVAYEPHAAWDRHASFMQAQSRAVSALNSSLKAYQQLLLGTHAADAKRQQAKLLKQKVKRMTESESPEIHIHTHIPRPRQNGENKKTGKGNSSNA